MASIVPGSTIEARCTRCNDITGHIVMAVVGGEIVKVECRACGSVHKYYPPATAKKAAARADVCRVKAGEDRKQAVNAAGKSTASGSGLSTATKAAAKPKVRKDAQDVEAAWQRSINTNAAAPKPYSMTGLFDAGDVLEHKVFGLGVVQEIQPPDKIGVLFREGVKLLRTGSK